MPEPLPNAPSPSSDSAPDAPVLVFDGQCSFCQRSVGQLDRLCGKRIAAEPAAVDPVTPTPPGEVRLVLPDGRTFGGAEAIVRTLALRPIWRLVTWVYFVPGIRQSANALYRFVARHRHRL